MAGEYRALVARSGQALAQQRRGTGVMLEVPVVPVIEVGLPVYVEAPEYYTPSPNSPPVFLAGGITDCPDWQAIVAAELAGHRCTVLNPRRRVFDTSVPGEFERQVAWEHAHLALSELIIMFWFPESVSPQPIALFELGFALATTGGLHRRLVVGADRRYPRAADVVAQVALARPELPVHTSLKGVVSGVLSHLDPWRLSDSLLL